MSRLVKGMYGGEFNPRGDLFGLRCGQIRSGLPLVHNGGWYNAAGGRLGWGDLSPGDFTAIRNGLEEDELFIVLGEEDAFWHFVQRPGLIGALADVNPDVEAPGVEYVAEHARYIITPQHFYVVARDHFTQEAYARDGLVLEVLARESAKHLIETAANQAA